MFKQLIIAVSLLVMMSSCVVTIPAGSTFTLNTFKHKERCKIVDYTIYLQDIFLRDTRTKKKDLAPFYVYKPTAKEKVCFQKASKIIKDPKKKKEYIFVVSYKNVTYLNPSDDPDVGYQIFSGLQYQMPAITDDATFPSINSAYSFRYSLPKEKLYVSDVYDRRIPEWGEFYYRKKIENVKIKASLVNYRRVNMMYVEIFNSGRETVYLSPSEIRFQFDDHEKIKPDARDIDILLAVLPGQTHQTWIPFPSKKDFRKSKKLQAKIVFHDRMEKSWENAVIEFERIKDNVHHFSYEEWTAYDFGLMLGGHFYHTGKQKEILDSYASIGLSWQLYPFKNKYHGFDISVFGSFAGESGYLDTTRFDTGDLTSISLGYSFRHHFISDRMIFRYSFGPSFTIFEHKRESEEKYRYARGLGTVQSIGLDWIALSNRYSSKVVTMIGATIYHQWVPSDSIAITGHTVGAGIHIKLGY